MNTNLDGRFEVKGPLRCSGVGSLVCAQDQDGSRAAIRTVPEQAKGREAVAAVLKLPVHPVLPRAIGSGHANGSSWVALDFPEGTLLGHTLPLDTARLLAMGAASSSALAALHQSNVVHGELSADSVLVVPGREERFVLFDAPLVLMNRLTERRGEERLLAQLSHTVSYLSPERARGAAPSMASDIWALGALLSIAGGGKVAPGGSVLEKVAGIVSGKWRPLAPPMLPISLRLLIGRMVALEPRERPSSLDVAIELENLHAALGAQRAQRVAVRAAPAHDTNPVSLARVEALVEQMKRVDPFDSVAMATTQKVKPLTDVHAEPTRRIQTPLWSLAHDVTDPHAVMPTAPASPVFVAPVHAVPRGPSITIDLPIARAVTAAPVAQGPFTIQLDGEPALPLPLISAQIANPLPSPAKRPQPLPPILDPQAVVVAPPPALTPMWPRPLKLTLLADPEPMAQPRLETLRFGAPAHQPEVQTEEVAPAQVAEVRGHAAEAADADEIEAAFNSQLAGSRKRRLIAAGIGFAVLFGGAAVFAKSQGVFDGLRQEEEEVVVRRPRARKIAAVSAPAPVVEVVAAPEPAIEPEPLIPEPAVVAAPEPVIAEEPVKAAPRPIKRASTSRKSSGPQLDTPAIAAPPAPSRPASRLGDDD